MVSGRNKVKITNMKTILITGCAGLFGINFSKFLLEKKYKVIGIDNFFGGYKEYLPIHDNFIFYERNLESDNISDIFYNHKIDCVFHFAAYAAEGLSPFIRKFNYSNNIISSANVINHCIENDIKLIFTSSMAVYGDQKSPFNELMTPKPIDPYGIAKYAIEMDIISANEQFGLKYNIVRPHNVLGVYQNIWDKYRNVIGIFIRKTLNNENILVYGDGNQTRAFSNIKYYMEPLEKLITSHDNQTYNIGAEKYYTLNEVASLVQKIGQKNGYNPKIEHGEPRHEVKHAYCDHTKVINDLLFQDQTNVELLIEEMFKWAKGENNKIVKTMNYEIKKNIYEYWK
jgi:UDP-glucose 4-epimerase